MTRYKDGVNSKTLRSRFEKSSLKPKKPKPEPAPINSRQKGAAAERELASWLRDRGVEARRGQQFKGGGDSPDVVCGGVMSDIHLEVKRVEAGNLYRWYEQACRDAGMLKIPVVAHRKNGKPWLAIIDLRDLLNLLKEAKSPQQSEHHPSQDTHNIAD